jgi:hypothetical protein
MPERTQIEAGTKPSRRPVAGIGRVLMWSGGSLWIGRDAGRVESHAHHAVQISLAMDSGFLMRDGDAGWREQLGAIAMPVSLLPPSSGSRPSDAWSTHACSSTRSRFSTRPVGNGWSFGAFAPRAPASDERRQLQCRVDTVYGVLGSWFVLNSRRTASQRTRTWN